jgi:hypothetical protein
MNGLSRESHEVVQWLAGACLAQMIAPPMYFDVEEMPRGSAGLIARRD